jgi:acetyltransferase-like isoleucine patch superfamily enzyme
MRRAPSAGAGADRGAPYPPPVPAALHNRVGRVRAAAWLAARRRIEGGRGAVFLHGAPVLEAGGEVVLGTALRVDARPVRPTLAAAPGGRLEIGDHVFVNHGATIHAQLSVTIGSHVLVGDHVAIWDTDFHELEDGVAPRVAPVVVEDNVWLGRLAVVLPGVRIGHGSAVGAAAVVTRDVPPGVVVVGNPARVVRELRTPPGWIRA